jgi:hypothetical protein
MIHFINFFNVYELKKNLIIFETCKLKKLIIDIFNWS